VKEGGKKRVLKGGGGGGGKRGGGGGGVVRGLGDEKYEQNCISITSDEKDHLGKLGHRWRYIKMALKDW